MSFDVHKIKPHKKKIILVVGIVVIIAILGVAFYEVFKNTASADTNIATYTYTGKLRTSTGHSVPSKLVQNGLVSVTRYYAKANCTGASTAATKSAATDAQGSFTLTGLSKGCYSMDIQGNVRNSAGRTVMVGSYLNFVVPGTVATKNFYSAARTYQLLGSFSRTGGTIANPTISAIAVLSPVPYQPPVDEEIYTVQAKLTDNNDIPIANAMITNVGPQRSEISRTATSTQCNTTSPTVAVTPATDITDAEGNFILYNLTGGCYTLQVDLDTGPTMSPSAVAGRALLPKETFSLIINPNAPAGADGSVALSLTNITANPVGVAVAGLKMAQGLLKHVPKPSIPYGIFTGTVMENGKAAAGATITDDVMANGAWVRVGLLGGNQSTPVTRADGSFTLGAHVGINKIHIVSATTGNALDVTIEMPGGAPTLPISQPLVIGSPSITAGGAITGTVTKKTSAGADLGPAIGASLSAYVAGDNGAQVTQPSGVVTTTDSSGKFTIGGAPGTNRVHVAAVAGDNCAEQDTLGTLPTGGLNPTTTVYVVLVCTGPGSVGGISGKVLRKDTIPAGGVHLYIKNAVTNLQDPQDIVANSDGTFSIGPVPAGSFVVGVDVNTPANQGVLTVPGPTGPTQPNCQSWTSKKLTVVGGKSTPITPDINLNCDN